MQADDFFYVTYLKQQKHIFMKKKNVFLLLIYMIFKFFSFHKWLSRFITQSYEKGYFFLEILLFSFIIAPII